MNKKTFPRTKIGDLSVSRMVMGTNNIMGGSHRTRARDLHIKEINNNINAVADIVETYLSYGVDTVIGILMGNQFDQDGIDLAEQRTGKKVNRIELAVFDTSDSKKAREEANEFIKSCAKAKTDICLPLHTVVEEFIDKKKRTLNRIDDYLDMIRQAGMIPGLSAHMPEVIEYADENEYDVETYIQIFNASGFLMQKEIEIVHDVIWEAKKPVLTIKAMAAGHLNPFIGLTFSWNAIREQDMVAVGCMTPQEVHETVEYSMAAIEHRRPIAGTRSFQYDNK
jgi:hypothetical protein